MKGFGMIKCAKCGHEYNPPKNKPLGRPKKLDDKMVKIMRKRRWPLSRIANHFGVSRGAVQASIKRNS